MTRLTWQLEIRLAHADRARAVTAGKILYCIWKVELLSFWNNLRDPNIEKLIPAVTCLAYWMWIHRN